MIKKSRSQNNNNHGNQENLSKIKVQTKGYKQTEVEMILGVLLLMIN